MSTGRKVFSLKESLYQLKESALKIESAASVVGPIFRLPEQGYLRDQLDVPVSTAPLASDTVLFEDAGNAATLYYLPRYKLDTESTVDGKERYKAVLEARAPGWVLRLHLVKYAAEELGLADRQAQPLPHRTTLTLRYTLAGSGGVQKELAFGEVTEEENGLLAAIQLNGMAERDELYAAMTKPESKAEFIVRRSMQVAVPIPGSSNDSPHKLPDQRIFIPRRRFPLENGSETVSANLKINPAASKPEARLRSVIRDSQVRRTGWTNISLDSKAKRIDWTNIVVRDPNREPAPAAAPPQRYRKLDLTLDCTLPFYFPSELHGYIYGGIGTSAESPGLIACQVRWGSQHYSYYQETSRPYLFYYLPDCFKLARQPEAPHLPFMTVGFSSEDGSLEAARAKVAYAAAPFVDSARLEAAAVALRPRIGGALPEGIDGLVFEPLLADSARLAFRLALPGANGLFQAREGAMVNLKLGIIDSLDLSLPELQALFDALMGAGASVLMTGEVEVGLDDEHNRSAEKVPFTARMTDLAGETFEYRHSFDPAKGGYRVSLRNSIESPLRIERLGIQLTADGNETAFELRDAVFPVERLASGEELVFTIVPQTAAAGASPVDIAIDHEEGVTVMPDREAIWNAIQESYTAQYLQIIKVKTLPAIFQLPEGRPEAERLSEIVVELKRDGERSVSVSLNPESLEVEASLPFPIGDVILRREDSGEYSCKVTAIRLSGETVKDWKKKTGDRLFILQDDVT
ncbi:hypothetical protein ACFPVX_03010 [Cohnella faecalis]|uniref:hypothetical protein n=1 Tax=Cohnella faecalis TaxID=2315694 RepID=UPI00360F015E